MNTPQAGWRGTFIFCGSLCGLMSAISLVYLVEHQAKNQLSPSKEPKQGLADLLSPLKLVAANPLFWLVMVLETMLTVLLDSNNIVPTFLKESCSFSTKYAGIFSTAAPTGGSFALLMCGYFHERMTRQGRALHYIFSLLVSLVSLVGLAYSDHHTNPILVFVLLFSFGTALAPVKYMIGPLFCSALGGARYLSTLLSIMDVPGFMATVLLYRYFDVIVQMYGGWSAVFHVLAVMNFLGLVCLAVFLYLENHTTTSPHPIVKSNNVGALKPQQQPSKERELV